MAGSRLRDASAADWLKMYRRGQKEDHLDTILYEIDMLDFAYAGMLAKERSGEPGESNAHLECFLLHYRNLLEFFSPKTPWKDGTDLRVGTPRVWARPGLDRSKFPPLVQPGLYKKYWSDLSRYLDHLTTHRAHSPRPWNPRQMYDEMNPTLEAFVQAARLTRVVSGGVRPGGASPLPGEAKSTSSGPRPSLGFSPSKRGEPA